MDKRESNIKVGRYLMIFGAFLLVTNYILAQQPESGWVFFYPVTGLVFFMGLIIYFINKFLFKK